MKEQRQKILSDLIKIIWSELGFPPRYVCLALKADILRHNEKIGIIDFGVGHTWV